MTASDLEEPADGGSILMALLVTLVGLTLSASLVPIVVNQIASSRTISARLQALDAAQSGIDVALGQIRSAAEVRLTVDAPLVGRVAGLPPCVMTGSAGSGNLAYTVTISYLLLNGNPSPACPPTQAPIGAKLTSTGGPRTGSGALAPGGAGTRTVEATYTFKTTADNISGGAIPLAAPIVKPLCMDGGVSASPATGTRVTLQLCIAGGSSRQRFAYGSDLSIELVGSERTTAAYGMCLEAPRPHATGGLVTFQPCVGSAAYQQWSFDDNSMFRGTTDGKVPDAYCLSAKVADNNPGSDIVLGSCNSVANQTVFRPQPGVGAGKASAATNQLVNFEQFSRCLDVTNQTATSSFMIVWFCKQSPDGTVTWNQQWALPPLSVSIANTTPERIRTLGSGNPGYCLRTPGSTLANQYVTMTACAATGVLADNNLKWTVFGDTGNYATSYRIIDSYGYCLTPTDLNATIPDTYTDGTAKAKVAPCDNSGRQKWNAPANFNQPLVLTNTCERTRGDTSCFASS